jgi:hypothetical protein
VSHNGWIWIVIGVIALAVNASRRLAQGPPAPRSEAPSPMPSPPRDVARRTPAPVAFTIGGRTRVPAAVPPPVTANVPPPLARASAAAIPGRTATVPAGPYVAPGGVVPAAAAVRPSGILAAFGDPARARTAIVLAEVLGPPRALR